MYTGLLVYITVHQRTQQAQLLVTFYVLSMEPLIPNQVASSEEAT